MAKILFVMTGATYWTLNDGTRHPTGYWAEEFVAPYSAFRDAGHEIVVATPGAIAPTVDAVSLTPDMAGGEDAAKEQAAVIDGAEELRRTIDLGEVQLSDYAAVYYPGGHGPLEDLAFDRDSGKLLIDALGSGKPLGIVCHAPAALRATVADDGTTPFAGYRVSAFSNEEERQVGLAEKAPWLVQDEVVSLGAKYDEGEPWAPHIVVDRNLYTGQNPASSAPLAEELLKALP
ncbi:type 1 glutamine amidotransferase domain-containing protein [Pseudonocardia alni]|uniref:type 1 glutamine amidotransferase domain-containing protein n=1 Tax=Pseudonocardia TaxID=1847 RepID=UPI0001FFDAA6|nr:type 1 glutamine amidotransferase domain-containing protein [Pseudonocardia sp. Ae707_Ps1]OLM20078.1 ThiJ/PfpI family protein [Pseudonocardia sp. Ae707_Ps1]WFG45152.1 type 1 glutamine amidotransferase domain-containing protein [Pseudonocardia alni]